jgi:polysaccharide deacetylase 2 family uncharacterized protein YibQ
MMSQVIRVRIDKDNEMPFEAKVNATDRISIIIDDLGISIRSDGESLELSNKVTSTDIKRIDNFVNQLSLFDSKPWKMDK